MLDVRYHTFRIIVFLFAGVWSVAAARDAGAACNDPPDPSATVSSAHAGASGSISSPFLIPGKLAGDSAKRTITITAKTGSTHGPVTGDVLTVAVRDSSPQVAAIFAANCSAVSTCNPAVPCHNINSLSFGTTPSSVTFETSDVLDKLENTGPVRLAVTPPADVPCALATLACPAVSSSMHACIDDVTPSTVPNYDVASVTALPEPNEFWKFCKPGSGSSCSKTAGAIRYTIDLRGDMLVPFDWAKLIKKQGGGSCKEGDSCELRGVYAGTNVYSGIAATPVIDIPCPESETYLQSFSAAGTAFATGPLFQVDPNSGTTPETRLLGTIDKAFSVLRIRRCPQADPACAAPKFALSLGTADYLEIAVPAGKTGTCSGSGTECSSTDPCPSGEKCIWFDGEDRGPLASQPLPSCDPSDEAADESGIWVMIVIILAGVVLVIWVFRRK